jgi:hypothetical protein
MELKEIRIRKALLEKQLYQIITEFQKDTEVTVTRIELTSHPSFGEISHEFAVQVDVEVKI